MRTTRATALALTIAALAAAPALATATTGTTGPSSTTTTAARPAARPMLVYASDGDGDSEIFIRRADGSTVQLTRNPASDFDPAWSPDGRQIAFTSDRDGDDEIYVMDADGGRVRQLTRNRLGPTGAPALDGQPAWSPDGRRIAFASTRDGGEREIYVMDADGRRPRRLTRTPAYVSNDGPDWSPDGKVLAFSSNRVSFDNSELFRMRADGSDVRRLTRTPNGVDENAPAWSPDGRSIAFTSNRAGTHDVYVMRADGRAVRAVTGHVELDDVFPRWTGNGRQLVFWNFARHDGAGADLWSVGIDGRHRQRITDAPAAQFAPDPWPRATVPTSPAAGRPHATAPAGKASNVRPQPFETFRGGGRTLVLGWWGGHPDCTALDRVEVRETAQEVVVTLHVGDRDPGRMCIAVAQQHETVVELASPLGTRRLRDGAR